MIARHGVAPLLLALAVAVIVVHFHGWSLSTPAWLLVVLLLVLYRDPDRKIPSSPLSVVSPADGRVLSVAQQADPYLDRDSLKISIKVSPFGAYTTRSPVEGKALEPPGNNTNGSQPNGVWLQTDEGDDIVVVMTRGRMRNRPRCNVGFGERVGHGQRYGFLQWGGRVDVYLPDTCRPEVEADARVLGGSDVIASIVRN